MVDIKSLVKYINSLGYNTYTFDYSVYHNYIQNMLSWYNGDVADFHTERIYNGDHDVVIKKSRLNMAKRVCEDSASLTFNENIQINVKSDDENKYLLGYDEMTGILGENDFWKAGSELYEITCALGTGAFEVVVVNLSKYSDRVVGNKDSKIKIVQHNALEILPLSWDNNKNIKEVAFIDQYKIKNTEYVDLRLHVLENGFYKIVNRRLKVTCNTNFVSVDDTSILDEFNTGSDIPWFSILKLPIVNNYDIKSVMGASIYGNSLDILKGIDESFSMLNIEIKHGAKKIFYNKCLLNRDNDTGRVIYPDDQNGRLVFYYSGNETNTNLPDGQKLIQEFNPTLRINDIHKALQVQLDMLSHMCGLGHNYYSFDQGTVQKTATEVISENSSMYRNIRKNELALEKVLLNLFRALMYVSNLCLGTHYNIDVPISIEFDASIIEDKTAIRQRELEEVKLGILPVEWYQNKYYKDIIVNNDIANKNEE